MDIMAIMTNLHGLTFIWWWVFLLLPVPLLLRYRLKAREQGLNGALKVPFFAQLNADTGHHAGMLQASRRYRALLLYLIWLALVTATARPTLIGKPIPLPAQGRDIMLAIDLSDSMDERDLAGGRLNRLAVVKAAADEFIARRKGDRMGLILFSERAYLQAPLTFDRHVVRELLREAQVGLTGQRTALGDAIAVALKRLQQRPAPANHTTENHTAAGNTAANVDANSPAASTDSRVVVLLTDGANTAGVMAPMQAAKLAKKLGIRIYTIGVGSQRRSIFGRGNDLDENTLTAIAETTGGRYFRATDAQTLDKVYREIDRLVPITGEALTVHPEKALFYYPGGLALLLSAILAGLIIRPAFVLRKNYV